LATGGETGPVRPRRPPRIWPWLIAVLVVVLAGLGAAYALTRDDDSSESATVPNVVGLREAEAVRRIRAADLRPNTLHYRTGRAVGRVFLQRPRPGSEVEPDSTVMLGVSRGPGEATVPRLIGLSEAEAAERLSARRLEPRVVRVASRRPVGTVVAQNPSAGQRLDVGASVRMNVSRGRAARRTTTTTTTTTATTTTTTTTTTAPGATTTARTRTGAPATATVPDVVGLDAPTAEQRLRRAGFAVRSVPRNTTDPAEDGIVLEQRPSGGALARRGSQVLLTVGALTP
jgi:eukaryotic-like serine/threonine-protein kinase